MIIVIPGIVDLASLTVRSRFASCVWVGFLLAIIGYFTYVSPMELAPDVGADMDG